MMMLHLSDCEEQPEPALTKSTRNLLSFITSRNSSACKDYITQKCILTIYSLPHMWYLCRYLYSNGMYSKAESHLVYQTRATAKHEQALWKALDICAESTSSSTSFTRSVLPDLSVWWSTKGLYSFHSSKSLGANTKSTQKLTAYSKNELFNFQQGYFDLYNQIF